MMSRDWLVKMTNQGEICKMHVHMPRSVSTNGQTANHHPTLCKHGHVVFHFQCQCQIQQHDVCCAVQTMDHKADKNKQIFLRAIYTF